MTDAWPSNVPSCQLVSTTEQIGDPRLRSQPDAGPALVRRRTSAVVDLRTGQIRVNETQWQALLTFGRTTLLGWSLPFLYPDSGGELMRFGEKVPSRRRTAAGHFLVDLELEVLP